jgi:hypothetical protein
LSHFVFFFMKEKGEQGTEKKRYKKQECKA